VNNKSELACSFGIQRKAHAFSLFAVIHLNYTKQHSKNKPISVALLCVCSVERAMRTRRGKYQLRRLQSLLKQYICICMGMSREHKKVFFIKSCSGCTRYKFCSSASWRYRQLVDFATLKLGCGEEKWFY
jgi:hypothetical protein